MTAPKKPEDRLIPYPNRRARPGLKTAARIAALRHGDKMFFWNCPRHGMAPFSTAGSGTCRHCIAARQRGRYQREKLKREAAEGLPPKEGGVVRDAEVLLETLLTESDPTESA